MSLVHLAGYSALFDEPGSVGNPTSDSARSRATPIARTAMCVSQVVPGVEQGRWVLGKGAAR